MLRINSRPRWTRRDLLRGLAVAAGAPLIAACGAATPSPQAGAQAPSSASSAAPTAAPSQSGNPASGAAAATPVPQSGNTAPAAAKPAAGAGGKMLSLV